MSATLALATAADQADPLVPAATVEEKAPDVAAESGDIATENVTAPGAQIAAAAEPRAEASTATPAVSHPEQEHALARIRQSAVLPPAVRERLAALVESSGELTVGEAPRVPLEACLAALEESWPEFLRESRADALARAHPAGEAFFRGNSADLSDEQAEQLAQRQLARSGLLRGQRVRVAD